MGWLPRPPAAPGSSPPALPALTLQGLPSPQQLDGGRSPRRKMISWLTAAPKQLGTHPAPTGREQPRFLNPGAYVQPETKPTGVRPRTPRALHTKGPALPGPAGAVPLTPPSLSLHLLPLSSAPPPLWATLSDPSPTAPSRLHAGPSPAHSGACTRGSDLRGPRRAWETVCMKRQLSQGSRMDSSQV